MRSVAVVTVGRSDYGIYLPILRRIGEDPRVSLRLIVGGAHLNEGHGGTVREIEADGWPIAARVEMSANGDSPAEVVETVARGLHGFGAAFRKLKPDWVLILGDRYEMFAAAAAAGLCAFPLAHIHGGELSEGAIDDSLRHAMTKLSHLHFVSAEVHAQRVRQMGEEPWRVVVSGAPALDKLRTFAPLEREEFAARVGIASAVPFLLVTWHPVTLELAQSEAQIDALLEGLRGWPHQILFTAPNADAGSGRIRVRLAQYVGEHRGAVLVESLGGSLYFSAMHWAAAMVGNSSSGLIEAASFQLPVVNIGARQAGRLRPVNVIDVDCQGPLIAAAIQRATGAEFAAGLKGVENPYGDGRAAARIVDTLASVPMDGRLLRKRFVDR